ncbi:MAG TPA: MurR/RpiR family transcriptional regulator [Acidimicrobiales bacterium]
MPTDPHPVAALIEARRRDLTPAERRVADVVLSRPQAVAFGTVADLARQASTSGATVMRLASKLGLDGFSALQASVQDELAHRLRPAAERIREAAPPDVVGRVLATELDNVQATLDGLDRGDFATAVTMLADSRAVHVSAGEASRGAGLVLVDGLSMLRQQVALVAGHDVGLGRALADITPGDVVVAIDFRRYERWVVRLVELAARRGARIVALTDSRLSPLAEVAAPTFVVRAEAIGPFDSHVGTLALVNVLTAAVATRLRDTATDRLDRIESAWQETDALVDGARP